MSFDGVLMTPGSGILEKPNFFGILVDFFRNLRIITSCMDTQKDYMIPECGDLPDLTGFQLVVGGKQLRKALQNRQVKFVYLAGNADPVITAPLEKMCREVQVAYSWVPTMKELGCACGIDVGAAAAAVVESF